MKRLIVFLCLALTALSLHARAIQEDYRQAEERAQVSYAFGLSIGINLRSVDLDLDLDFNAFTDGMRAAFGEAEAQFSEDEALEIIETAMQQAMERRAEAYRLREREFLARNSQREGVNVTATGLQYVIVEAGEGALPNPNSVVRVFYEGMFTDGTVFDSATEADGGAYIPLDMVIPGWAEGLLLMNVGSTYRFYIPSHLAYGRSGIPSIIPPYSVLVFTVELLDIINDEEFFDDEGL